MAQRIDRAASFGQNLYVDTRGAAGEPVPFTQAVINSAWPKAAVSTFPKSCRR